MIINKIAKLLQIKSPFKRWVTLHSAHPTKGIIAVLWLLLTINVHASFNVYEFTDKTQETRFNHLISDLRCPKCQNNNLADSNAPLATDIKNYVYQSVRSGKSNEEITEFLVSRYGLFIVYDPKVIWLWLTPVLITLIGLVWGVISIKSRRKITPVDLPSMESLIAEHEQHTQSLADTSSQ